MSKATTYIILLVLFGALFSCTVSKPLEADLVITNANIVDVQEGKVLPNKTIIIKDGTIQEIIGTDTKATYKTASTIDAAGKYVIPGLWDNHVHLRGGPALEEENKNLLPLYIANGITTVRDAGGDLYPSIRAWRKQIEAGNIAGPHIISAGPKLDGPNPTWEGSIEVPTVAEVPAALDSLQKLDVDFVKIYDSTISGDVFLAIVKEAEKRGMQVSGHMPFTIKLGDAIDLGLDATEHLYYAFKAGSAKEDSITQAIVASQATAKPIGFYDALHMLYDTYDPQVAARTFNLMAEKNTAVVPTLYISSVLNNLKYEDHSQDAYLPYIGEGIIKTYERRISSAKRQPEASVQFMRDLNAKFHTMVPPMQKAGVTILAGSDAGAYNSYVYPGQSLHKELEMLVEAGLTPAQALRTATINGARFLNRAQNYGTVEAGKAADLVLLDKNPLEAISNTQRIQTVIFGGKVYTHQDLQQLLEQVKRK
ncbi:amidohydrolase family protein [Pontibacter sp. MBLB2868]|uniref:amidohydrolase family protein n=1 Tax=Pontibacter sp. MBLB2868 TaxID=3451555 RepID=UPI003F7557E9